MDEIRCWACHHLTDEDGDCRNPRCPTLRDARYLTRMSRSRLLEIDRDINKHAHRTAEVAG